MTDKWRNFIDTELKTEAYWNQYGIFSAKFKNKEVLVYYSDIDDTIYIKWYMNGYEVKPSFTKEIADEILEYIQCSVIQKSINHKLLCDIKLKMETYLPYMN